jgi:RNA recognition motif-containing protein
MRGIINLDSLSGMSHLNQIELEVPYPALSGIVLMIVLSRTLFVGGITSRISEDKVRALFSQFGGVQSIIMNPEKRCAFLKMYTREGAINAREGMETYPTEDTTIRVPPIPPIFKNLLMSDKIWCRIRTTRLFRLHHRNLRRTHLSSHRRRS